MKIYPKYDLIQTEESTTISTTLRIKQDEKWYLKEVIITRKGKVDVMKLIEAFIRAMYFNMLFVVVSEGVTDNNGVELYKLDPDQREEQERFKEDHPIKISGYIPQTA